MNILVTAIGSFASDCVIKSLKEMNHRVFGCDTNPKKWIVAAKDCESFYRVPLSKEERKYINMILDICCREKIDFLFPLTDVEVDVLNRYRNEFNAIDCKLCIQSNDCLSVARNKWNMYKLFQKETEFKVPATILFDNYCDENIKFPCVLKPIDGRSSEGLLYLSDKEDLDSLKLKSNENCILQEYIEGAIYTVDYVRDSFSNDFSIVREELLRTKNGAGTTVRIGMNDTLARCASIIGRRLGIIGAVNFEFVFNNDQYYLIDINPRFSAGVAFSGFVGYDIIRSSLNCFMNKKILDPISFEEQIICKRYKEELV